MTSRKRITRHPKLVELLVDGTDFEEHIAVGLGTLAYAILRVFEPESVNGKKLLELIRKLPQRQHDVIILHFGLEGKTQKKLDEIGNEFGVSKQRIKQIEDEVLEKFRCREYMMEFYISYKEEIKEEKKEQYSDIDGTGLPRGVCEALKRAGFKNIKDFQNTSLNDLMKIKDIGYRRAVRILEKLKEYNIPVQADRYTRIENVGISANILKALKRAGYRYLEEFQKLPIQYLRNIEGVGVDGAKEVQEKLKEFNILFQDGTAEKGGLGDITIEDAVFSNRTYYALKRAGFKNLGELQAFTLEDLKKIKGIGQKISDEVLKKLSVLS